MKIFVLCVALAAKSANAENVNLEALLQAEADRTISALKSEIAKSTTETSSGLGKVFKSFRSLYTTSTSNVVYTDDSTGKAVQYSSQSDPDICKRIYASGCTYNPLSSLSLTVACSSCGFAAKVTGATNYCYTCPSGNELVVLASFNWASMGFSSTQCVGGMCVPSASVAAVIAAGAASYKTLKDASCTMPGTTYPLVPGQGTCNPAAATCFSGSDQVTLESGALKNLADLKVGDRILSADAKGSLSYSDVVFLPHGANNQEGTFIEIATASKKLKATPMHLMVTCDGSLAYAGSLQTGNCLRTIDGEEAITSAIKTTGNGLYTAVTQNEFLVVNGVIASPFAVAHGVTNMYYNIHRALYKLMPSIMKSSSLVSANSLLGATAVAAMAAVPAK